MARPQKTGLDYFPHDTDAQSDEKIEALCFLYGNDGYAFYFRLLERIYRSENAELDVSDAEILQILTKKLLVSAELFQQILNTSLKLGLFDKVGYTEKHVLTSPGIQKRASQVTEKRQEMRSKYEQKRVSSPISASETTQETKQKPDKVKESKGNKRIVSVAPKVAETFEEYVTKVTPEFPTLDIDYQLRKWKTWCSEGKKPPERPKSSFRNWLERAVTMSQERATNVQRTNNAQTVLVGADKWPIR